MKKEIKEGDIISRKEIIAKIIHIKKESYDLLALFPGEMKIKSMLSKRKSTWKEASEKEVSRFEEYCVENGL